MVRPERMRALRDALADLRRYRGNVIAHFYPVVDLKKVYSALDQIADLDAFAAWAAQSS
jgi:uncharacterized protein YutE (UPF0331/DUF86 family)